MARLPPDRGAVEICRPWGPSLGGDRIAGELPYTHILELRDMRTGGDRPETYTRS
jgi:hypothetical protein